MQDLRLALRHARSSPGFFLAGVLSIAVGIGAVTAVFSIANRLLLAPLPVAGPSGLYAIRERRDGFQSDGIEGMRMPFDRYQAYRAAAGPAFAGMAAHAFTTMSLRADGDATTVNGVIASGNYFDVLGVRPGLGRLFTRDDEPAVVLSHALWQTRFGGRRDVLGRTIHLDGQPFAVAGVAPAGFDGTFPTLPAQVWVPARAYHAGEARPRGWVAPFGRLRPGVSLSSAEAYTRIMAMRIPPDPDAEIRGAVLEPVTPVPEDLRQPTKTFLAILLATAGLVLLIAAVNLAGMLLARGAARRREIGVRLALGATHARVVRQLLTETLVLYAAGGGLGLGLCTLGTGLLAGYRLPVSQRVLLDYAPDYRVLGFALVLSLITGVVFGLAPALHAARADLASTLKEGDRGTTRATGLSVFVAAQIALSVVLLVSAGLFARSLRRALTAELGFDPHGVATAEMDLAPHGYDETRGRGFFSQLEEAVRQLPGVESVALARLPPLSAGSMMGSMIQPAGTPDEHTSLHTSYDIVDPAFFPTVRAPIVAGRALGPQDGPGAPGVAVLNQTLARRFWPGENPIGTCPATVPRWPRPKPMPTAPTPWSRPTPPA